MSIMNHCVFLILVLTFHGCHCQSDDILETFEISDDGDDYDEANVTKADYFFEESEVLEDGDDDLMRETCRTKTGYS